MRRLVTRYFAVYMVFLFLLIALVSPMYAVTMNALEENAIELNREALAAGVTRFEDELNTALQVACALYENQYMATLSYMNPSGAQPSQREAYQMLHAQECYNTLSKMLTISSDSGILFANGVTVASQRIHLLKEEYYGAYIRVEGCAAYEDWRALLNGGDGAFKLFRVRATTLKPTRDCVALSVSQPLFAGWKHMFYALFDEADVLSMLTLPEALAYGALRLSWAQNETLIDYAAPGLGKTVSLFATGGAFGLRADLRLDRAALSESLRPYRTLLLGAILVFVMAGLSIALLFANKNAKPMAHLQRAAEAVGDELNAEDYKTGYEYLGAFIQQVDRRLKDNRLKLASQELTIRENLLERLVRGDMDSPESFESARIHLPDFPSPCRIALTRLEDAERMSPQDNSTLQLALKEIMAASAYAPGISHFTADVLVTFLPDADADALTQFIQRAGREIAARTGLEYRLCVSEAFSDMEDVHKTFLRARNALWLGNQPLQLLAPHPAGDGPAYAGVQCADAFYERLSRAQLEAALSYLSEDTDALMRFGDCSEEDVQQLFFAYRQALSRILSENPEIAGGEALPGLPKYTPRASMIDALEPIRQYSEALSARIAQTRMDSASSFEQSVLSAVEERLSDPNLSVPMMTALFSVSPGTLQRIMRAASDKSFLEYVTSRRMALAKQLLTQTDTPIREIIQRTGYLSDNAFYKTFKRKYDTSPAAMRREARGEGENGGA